MNTKIVNFLDITLDLETEEYKPYMKENDHPVYVDIQSNHPSQVLKNIPMAVKRRLSKITSNKEIFEKAKEPFKEALKRSGHKHTLEYTPAQDLSKKKKNRRKLGSTHPFL